MKSLLHVSACLSTRFLKKKENDVGTGGITEITCVNWSGNMGNFHQFSWRKFLLYLYVFRHFGFIYSIFLELV